MATATPSTVAPGRGIRTPSARAIATSSAPPTTIRAAPTATGDALGPIAWTVPVVPKQMAAVRTWARGPNMVDLFHNLLRSASADGPTAGPRRHADAQAGAGPACVVVS